MDLTPKNTVLIDRFEKALKVKRSTARVYASSIASLAKKMNEKTDDLAWLKKKKIKKHVADINNLTRRKNLASGIIAALKVIDERKIIEDYRTILMQADKDYTAYLQSGKRKRPYKDADREWTRIKALWKKASAVVSAQKLFEQGERVNPAQYRTLQALIYLKFLPYGGWSITKYVSSIQNHQREATTLLPTKINHGCGLLGNTKLLNGSESKSSQSRQDLKRFLPDFVP